MITREFIKKIESNELIKTMILSRMLIGAAGAFTLYAIFGSGYISNLATNLYEDNLLGFIALGIISGFSEQLFVESINKSSQNLRLVGTTCECTDDN